MGEFLLDWDVVRATPDPHAQALRFARVVFHHASALGDWDKELADSIDGEPSPTLR